MEFLEEAVQGGLLSWPDHQPAGFLDNGILAALAGHWPEARGFAEHAIVAADWCLNNGSLRAKPAERFFPGNWAWAVRDRAYARWFLGHRLDRGELLQSSRKAAEWLWNRDNGVMPFHPIPMQDHLAAVRTALIGFDPFWARQLLARYTKIRWGYLAQLKLFQRLIDEHPRCGLQHATTAADPTQLSASAPSPTEPKPPSTSPKAKSAKTKSTKSAKNASPAPRPPDNRPKPFTPRTRKVLPPGAPMNLGVSPELRLDVETYFDLVRPADANQNHAVNSVGDLHRVRFELALIRQMYLIHPDPALDPTPETIIAAIVA